MGECVGNQVDARLRQGYQNKVGDRAAPLPRLRGRIWSVTGAAPSRGFLGVQAGRVSGGRFWYKQGFLVNRMGGFDMIGFFLCTKWGFLVQSGLGGLVLTALFHTTKVFNHCVVIHS